jgi:hypothetical protein
MDVRKIKGTLHEAYPYLREKSLHHWKRTQQTLDAHHTRAQMLEYRKRILEKQQKMNYQNEYDRLRNALQETVLRRSVAGGMVRGPKIRGENEQNVLRRITELEAQGVKK